MYKKASKNEEKQDRNLKILVYLMLMFFFFGVIVSRLFYLQVIQFEENFNRSENNRLRQVILRAERGFVFDRKGRVLVRNRPSYQVVLQSMSLPKKKEERDSVFVRLLKIHDLEGKFLFDSLSLDTAFQRTNWIRNRPIQILEDATSEEIALIEERSSDLPGVSVLIESRREYPYGTLLAHVLGYTGEISEDQLQEEAYKNYSQGDRIGQKGLEFEYDEEFRGIDGLKVIEVNAAGREVGVIEGMSKEPVAGMHLITTIDLEVQKIAEQAFPDSVKGAAVAIDPRTGEIIAMVSSPRMDPNIFSLRKRDRNKGWAKVALDSTRPLTNRAVAGAYPPASVFKLVTAGAGLEHELIRENTHFSKSCTGGFQFGARYQKCWSSHGNLNVLHALRISCDVFFYQAGLLIDMPRINEFGERFGLGSKPLGVDIPGERVGWLPDSVSFNERNHRTGWRWTRGLILNLAIGQGQLVTPLQQAVFIGSLATNQGVYRPHFMKEIQTVDAKLVKKYEPIKIREGHMKPETHELLLKAMDMVVNHPGGTGKRGAVPGVRVGAKTGSGEWKKGEKTHAWYASVAPLDNPEIAVAVIMEASGGGGAVAAPVAQKIMQKYFDEANKEKETQ